MNAFTGLGYAANNELSPDMWKQYMLSDLDKQEGNMQKEYQNYLAGVAMQKKRSRQNDIFSAIQGAGGLLAKKAYGDPLNPEQDTSLMDKIDSNLTTQFEPTNVLDQWNGSFEELFRRT